MTFEEKVSEVISVFKCEKDQDVKPLPPLSRCGRCPTSLFARDLFLGKVVLHVTQGELDYAIRQALNNFDRWNDTTGAVAKGSGWYYEMQSCIEDAVRIGAKVACEGIRADLGDIFEAG
jgi:hypothetical protein